MFGAKFISAVSGVSKKNRKWYMLELISSTVTGNNKISKLFCNLA